MKSECASENPFAKKKKGPKTLEEIRIGRSADGKLTAAHHFGGYEHESEKREFPPDGKKFMAHVKESMGLKEAKGGGPDEAA